MSLWTTLSQWNPFRAASRGGESSTLQQPAWWLRAGWGALTLSGLPTSGTITPASALTLSTYFACLRNISEDVAKLPLCVYRYVPDGKERAREHPLYPLLHDAPNPDMTSIAFRETLTHFALGWGMGYAWILRDVDDTPIALYPLHPSRARLRTDQERPRYLVYAGDDTMPMRPENWRWIEMRDMLCIHGLGPDGKTGYSIAQLAARSLGITLAADTFGESFFENGAALGGVLEHPGTLTQEAAAVLRDSFQAVYGGPVNAGKVAVLEEGMKYAKIGIPPEDAQFLETRQFQVRDIARWFRMPLHKLQDLEFAHYNNVEQQSIEYVIDTLQPWLTRWEQELKRKLFVDDLDYFAEHNVKGLLRGDHMARAQFYKTLFELGVYTTNMILEDENENTAGEEGNIRFIAANNLQPLRSFLGAENRPASMPSQPQSPTDDQYAVQNGVHHE